MRARAVLGGAAIVLLAWTAPALAKGVSEGVIDGEGLAAPIVIDNATDGGLSPGDFGTMAALFGEAVAPTGPGLTPAPLLGEAPTSTLGPQLTVTWKLPGPNTEPDEIIQELYLYAEGGPLVHTEAGQSFHDGRRTPGGWYRASEGLVAKLRALGVPARPALIGSASDLGKASLAMGSDPGSRRTPFGAILAVMLLLGGGALVLIRRRRPAPAAT